jgi:TnpA family transposase
MMVSFTAFASTLKMEAICLSETSFDFQRNIRHYTSEVSTVYNHCCENFKYYIMQLIICDLYLSHNMILGARGSVVG